VSLRFFDLPKSNVRSRKRDVPVSAVEVVGPLGRLPRDSVYLSLTDLRTGQMTLPLPPYLTANHNVENKKVILNIGDPDVVHQRAMWGL
jgi:hypothetical protein